MKLMYIDLFCGAGGTSTGVENARYNDQQCAKVVACVNHDANAQILTVQAQREFPQLWAMIDTDEERTEQITIIFHGTGNPIENEACSSYIGTIQLYGGQLVLHAFLKYKQ